MVENYLSLVNNYHLSHLSHIFPLTLNCVEIWTSYWLNRIHTIKRWNLVQIFYLSAIWCRMSSWAISSKAKCMYHKTLLRAYLDRGEWWGHPDSLLKIINITVLNRSTCVPLQSLLSGNAPWMMKNANNDHKWTIYFRFSGFTWLPSVLVVSTWFQQFYKHLPHTYLLLMSFTKY